MNPHLLFNLKSRRNFFILHVSATSVSIPCPQETIFYNELVLTFPEGVEGRNVQSLQTCGDVSFNRQY